MITAGEAGREAAAGHAARPGITFPVDAVEPAPCDAMPTVDLKTSIEGLLGGYIEACDSRTARSLPSWGLNALLDAAHTAFHEHRPLVLSPDAIWLTIAHGAAIHINENAEELRDVFVRRQGREQIEVRRNSFVKGHRIMRGRTSGRSSLKR